MRVIEGLKGDRALKRVFTSHRHPALLSPVPSAEVTDLELRMSVLGPYKQERMELKMFSNEIMILHAVLLLSHDRAITRPPQWSWSVLCLRLFSAWCLRIPFISALCWFKAHPQWNKSGRKTRTILFYLHMEPKEYDKQTNKNLRASTASRQATYIVGCSINTIFCSL